MLAKISGRSCLLFALSTLAATTSAPIKTEWNPWVVGSVIGGTIVTGVGATYYFTSGLVGRCLLHATRECEEHYRLLRNDEKTESNKGYKKFKKKIIHYNNASILSALFGHRNFPLKTYRDALLTDTVLLWIFKLPNCRNETGKKMGRRIKQLCYIHNILSSDPTLLTEARDWEAKKKREEAKNEREEIKDLLKEKKRRKAF